MALAWSMGLLLGTLFYGGLWWTVNKAVKSQTPSHWLVGSMILRLSLVLTGLYVVSGTGLQHLGMALLGVLMVRQVAFFITRPERATHGMPGRVQHASQS